LAKVPTEVEQWNEYLKLKNFDPFDRVVLVKGIDNSILTSFRTLKGENNTVSDTFKIVHKKFQPSATHNSYFKNMITKHADKLPYQTNPANLYDLTQPNEEEELAAEFQIYEENKDGSVEIVTGRGGKNEQKFVLNPLTEVKRTEGDMEETQLL
jgi:hypothetical protein